MNATSTFRDAPAPAQTSSASMARSISPVSTVAGHGEHGPDFFGFGGADRDVDGEGFLPVVAGLRHVALGLVGVSEAVVCSGLHPWRADLGCEPQRAGVVRVRLSGVTGPEGNLPEPVERFSFQTRIADLAESVQGPVKVPGSLVVAAQLQIDLAEMGVGLGFPGHVPYFTEEDQCLLEVSGSVLTTAQPQVDNTQPAQCVGYALTVADLAEEIQGLPVIVDRLLVTALLSAGQAEVAERGCLAEAIANVAVDGDRRLLMAYAIFAVPKLHLGNAQVAQYDSLTGPDARLAVQG